LAGREDNYAIFHYGVDALLRYAILQKMQAISTLLPYIQLVISALLVTAVLLQQRGTGLGAAFGGEGNVYRTKRGFEQTLYRGTIILAVLFFGTAILQLLI
jgi:protein translocase SecG subunit